LLSLAAIWGSRPRAIYHRKQSECGGHGFIKHLVNRPTEYLSSLLER
jgi:hypothetical protein